MTVFNLSTFLRVVLYKFIKKMFIESTCVNCRMTSDFVAKRENRKGSRRVFVMKIFINTKE